MKRLINFQSKNNNKIAAFSAALTAFFMTHPVYAQNPTYLKHSKKALDGFQGDLNIIISIASAVILLCLAIGYAGRYIGKDTFIRWSIGIVIAGSSAELAKLLFEGKP